MKPFDYKFERAWNLLNGRCILCNKQVDNCAFDVCKALNQPLNERVTNKYLKHIVKGHSINDGLFKRFIKKFYPGSHCL